MTPLDRQCFLKTGMIFLLLLFLSACEPPLSKEGRKLYQAGKFEEALNRYRQLLTQDPDSPGINFQAALALYKTGNYQKAAEHLTKALLTEDRELEVRAVYNYGNCKFRQAEIRQKTDWAGAVDLYQTALQYYQRALELNKGDEDARFNVSFTEKRLNQLLSNPPKPKAKSTEDYQAKKKKNEETPHNKTLDYPSKQVAIDGENMTGQEKETPEGKGEKSSDQSLAEKRAPKSRSLSMSREEAETLLQAFQETEETARASKTGRKRILKREVEKDW
jgi:tetratricopeptide (TPR) repeat protein